MYFYFHISAALSGLVTQWKYCCVTQKTSRSYFYSCQFFSPKKSFLVCFIYCKLDAKQFHFHILDTIHNDHPFFELHSFSFHFCSRDFCLFGIETRSKVSVPIYHVNTVLVRIKNKICALI